MPEGSVIWELISRDHASSTNEKVGRSFEKLGRQTNTFGKIVGGLAGAVKYGAVAFGGLAGAAAVTGVKTAASLEQMQIGYTSLLGSQKAAGDYLKWLTKFAADTPFELQGLADASRLLLGVGVSAKDTKTILQDFGDTASAVGMDQAHFQMAMLATSQMISAGKVKLGDLNQMMNDGIPIWKLMSEATGKPVAKLQDMISKGQLLTKDVMPKLLAQMEKDYPNAMKKQSQTLAGLWSTLHDTVTLGLAQAIQPFMPQIREGLTAAINTVGSILAKFPGWVATARGALSRLHLGSLFADAKTAYDNAKAWFGKVVGGIEAAMQTHNWADIGGFLGSSLGSMLKNVVSAIGSWAQSVDWVDAGKMVGQFALPFVIGFVNNLFEPLFHGDFWEKHWKDVLLFAMSFIPFGKFGSLGGKIIEKLGLSEGVVGSLGKLLEGLMGKVSGWLQRFVKFLGREFFRAFESQSGNIARSVYDWAKDVVETGFLKALYARDAVIRAITSLVGFIPRTLGRLAGKVSRDLLFLAKKWVNDLAVGIRLGLGTVGDAITTVAMKIPQTAWSLASGIWGQMKSIAGFIVAGLVAGIQAKIADVQNAVENVATSIPGWLKDKLGIKSPSRVTALIGRQVVEGIVVGIKGTTASAKAAVDKLMTVVGDALDAHRQKLADLKTSYADLKSSVRDAFTIGLSDAGTTFSDIIANFQDRASSDKRMVQVIAQLRKMGLRADLLQQLAEGGPGSLDQANAILGSGQSGIRQLNGLQGQILSYGDAAGSVVAQQQYGAAIARETQAVNTLARIQQQLAAEMKHLNALLAAKHKNIDSAALARALWIILNQGRALGVKG